ncbi:hypothetical protein [Cystobacter ferrugineus]|uniref:Uncharacterized protein n=1 Tax=Cystobacter ferrugineus TaxID=83449 RepID=A0A1L9B384_9BACT|nr:hypothetical protein [Cystobacter ferrugineus]OJH36735.1 hypothetical protein BON30_29945 [Cystobacter ferrugineus]
MAARKKRQAGQGKPARQTTEAIEHRIPPLEYDPFTPGLDHPEWVRQGFPTYVEHTHESLARSVRTIEHQGRSISITTTYEVRVEGRLVSLHMMVDEEGQLWSHLRPYQTFASALELVSHLLTRMPHLFEAAPDPPPEHDPSTHGHAHGGAR